MRSRIDECTCLTWGKKVSRFVVSPTVVLVSQNFVLEGYKMYLFRELELKLLFNAKPLIKRLSSFSVPKIMALRHV